MANRDGSKEGFWRRMITRQAGSGLSVRAWCGRHDVPEASFYWWRRRLATSGRSAHQAGGCETGTPQFVPVRISADRADAASDSRPGCIEIILPSNHRVRVLGAVDRQALADVLAVVHDGGVESRMTADAESAAC
jgi:transposase-like protein